MSNPPQNFDPAEIDAIILSLCAAAPGKSISPTNVAKALDPENWRRHLSKIRARARALTTAGEIEILRKGKPVPPERAKGVIRLRTAV